MLGVGAALIAMAGASLVWGGFNEATPHGRLLAVLQQVGEAQETHWISERRFADRLAPLGIEPPAALDVQITRGDAREWEALAFDAEVGLGCRQGGGVSEDGRPHRNEPVCFAHR